MRLAPNPYDWSGVNLNLFYGRDKDLNGILRDLDRGKSCSVVGGRRIGKTTLLRKLEAELRKQLPESFDQGFAKLPIYIDMTTFPPTVIPRFLYQNILHEIERELKDLQFLGDRESYLALIEQFTGEESRGFREALLTLVRRTSDRCRIRIVVMLDEVERISATDWGQAFFDNWRALLSNDPPLSDHHHIVLVLAGAREMAAISYGIGSPLSNVMSWKEMRLLSHDAGLRLINEPTKNALDAAVVDEIMQQTDAHPWLIQYLMEYLCDFDLSEASIRLIEALDKFYEEQSGQFRYWWDLKLKESERRIYTLLAGQGGWVLRRDVVSLIGDTDAAYGLFVLCHTGIVRKAEGEERYRVAGKMFLNWFRDNAASNIWIPPHHHTIGAKSTVPPRTPHLQPSVVKSSQNDKPAFRNANALLIGVGGYTHLCVANLSATVRDVQAIATNLTDPNRCGYPQGKVETITGEKATAADIRAALQALAKSTNPQSTVFIYFSGHGGRALENGAWHTYLCPREADSDNLAHTAIPGDEFSRLLAAIPAQKMLVILDACHAGGSADLKAADGTMVWKAGLPDDYYEALSQGSGRVVIASSKEDQYSYVRKQGDLSLFTWHLREALSGKAAVRGDGLIHVLDVFHYVNEAVQADEPKQVPILKVKDLDLNFPIALDRGGKGAGAAPAISATPVVDLREQIVRDPISGARALSEHLKTRPEWAGKCTEVDLKRADLERIQHELDLFGHDPGGQAAKNRTVFFLLKVCLELEQSEQ